MIKIALSVVDLPACLTAESWKRIIERNGLRAALTAASDTECNTLEPPKLVKSGKVQCSMHRDKTKFVLALVREAAADSDDFTTIYPINIINS